MNIGTTSAVGVNENSTTKVLNGPATLSYLGIQNNDPTAKIFVGFENKDLSVDGGIHIEAGKYLPLETKTLYNASVWIKSSIVLTVQPTLVYG